MPSSLSLPGVPASGLAARQQALRDASGRVLAAASTKFSDPRVPVDEMGWKAVIEDSRVVPLALGLIGEVEKIGRLDLADPRVIGTRLRDAFLRLADSLGALFMAAEQVSWFDPPASLAAGRRAVFDAASSGEELALGLLDLLTGSDRRGAAIRVRGCCRRIQSIVFALESPPQAGGAGTSVLALVLGVPEDRLTDRSGVVASGRIWAEFADRPQELEQIGRRLLSGLIDDPNIRPPDAATFAVGLIYAERPLVCREAARLTLDLIRTRFRADANGTAASIERLLHGAANAASTHFDGIVSVAARVERAAAQPERARSLLELYRLVAEGPLRQTSWTVLELNGARASEVPTLSELKDRLIADGSPLARHLACSIHPTWRNAAAHEDHHWDHSSEKLRVGAETASPEDIQHAIGLAMSATYGYEIGVACARCSLPDLAAALDASTANQTPALLDLRIRNAFGRNGIRVWDTIWGRDSVEVAIDDDGPRSAAHQILAALLEAHLYALDVGTWRVITKDGSELIEADATALSASRHLLPQDPTERRIELNVLLPALASAKVHRGVAPAVACDEVTKVALKHPLWLAQDQAHLLMSRDPESIERLRSALDLAARSLTRTSEVVGQRPQTALDHLANARDAAGSWLVGDDDGFIRLSRHLNALLDLFHSLPDSPLLPPVHVKSV